MKDLRDLKDLTIHDVKSIHECNTPASLGLTHLSQVDIGNSWFTFVNFGEASCIAQVLARSGFGVAPSWFVPVFEV